MKKILFSLLMLFLANSTAIAGDAEWDQQTENIFVAEGIAGTVTESGSVNLRHSPDSSVKPVNYSRSEVMTSEKLGQIAGGLAIIIVLIVLVGAVVKKMSQGAFSGSQAIKMKGVLVLGNKEKIAVIEVEGVSLVVGVTAQSINTLHVLGQAGTETEKQSNNRESANFSQQLKEIISQGNTEE